MGYKEIDPNSDEILGFGRVQATMRNGKRCSAAKAFLYPILNRSNLHISMKSWVTQILIDSETKRTYGVELIRNKKKHRIHIRKEIIVAAGVIGSPQLLMLSGIGPSDHLKELNIPIKQNLSVGYNLQDHVGLPGMVVLVNKPITIIETNVQNPIDIGRYFFSGEGPFTSPGGAEGLAFVKLENSTLGMKYEVILLSQ